MQNIERIKVLKSRMQYLKNKLAFCDSSVFKITFLAFTKAQDECSLLESLEYQKNKNYQF